MCPFCQSSKTKKIISTDTQEIVACSLCTNAWTIPSPTDIPYEQEDFHAQFPFHSVRELPQQWKKCLFMQISLISSFLHPGASILEIGCGRGLLLKELEHQGFCVFGVEPSKTASQEARKNGLNVITGYFPRSDMIQQFDGVIMSHVLEHVAKPMELLLQIQKAAPGGVIMFVQSNWRGLMPRVYKSNWYAWAPTQHYWHFTPKGLTFIIQKLGWKTQKVEYSGLEHGTRLISRIGILFNSLADQFHLLARISGNHS